jgi:hypothetical protein
VTSTVTCRSGGVFGPVGTATSSGVQKLEMGTRQPTPLEVIGISRGTPGLKPELPLAGNVSENSTRIENTTSKCDAVGDGDGGVFVPPPSDCGTRPIKPVTLKLEYVRPNEMSIVLGAASQIEATTPFQQCARAPAYRIARSGVELPEAWLLPEQSRCRTVARSASRAGSSPLILVGKGGTKMVCRDAAAEVAACHEAARGSSSPLIIVEPGKQRRVRYVCKEGGRRQLPCESTSPTSSPLFPVRGKPRDCDDRDKEEKVCETSLRARGARGGQSPVFTVKGRPAPARPVGPCKFIITRTSFRRFGKSGSYTGTISTTWKLTLAPKRVPVK